MPAKKTAGTSSVDNLRHKTKKKSKAGVKGTLKKETVKNETEEKLEATKLLKKFIAQHKISLKLPQEPELARDFIAFCQTIAILRHPIVGCPWDLQQNHQTLRPFMLEESYEASHAMDLGNPQDICEELGDVLLQVVLNSQVAFDEKEFSIRDVLRGITQKMIARHPHVFLRAPEDQRLSPAEVLQAWDSVKSHEQKESKGQVKVKGYYKEHGIDKIFPASTRAHKIGVLAEKVGFDWPGYQEVWHKLKEEMAELETELKHVKAKKPSPTIKKRIKDEIGDVYFTLAQLCRHLSLSPEVVAADANEKFLTRFQKIEEMLANDKKKLSQVKLSELEKYWHAAKKIASS